MMNKFTDEDLAKLKEKITRSPQGSVFEPKQKWVSLLARLEAAERLIEVYLGPNGAIPMDDDELYNEWLRSCGRAQE